VRVLLTGAAGHIGTVVAQRLADRHDFRGLDLRVAPQAWAGEYVVGDCADPDIASEAVAGMDALVHLAGIATEASLPAILHSHVESTAALLDAMVEHGVDRMVYASSNHAVGMTPRTDLLPTSTRARPDTFYGVGKVAAEGLLSLYADRHGIASVAIRIGSFLERPTSRRNLATWLSYDDCAAMVHAALTAELEGYTPIYGISANSDGWWDLEPGRALGYHPIDDAADYASGVEHRPEDEAEGAYVGGPFATGAEDRRPFGSDAVDDD